MKQKVFNFRVDSLTVYDNAVSNAIKFKETFTTRETSYSASIIFPKRKAKYFYSFDRNKNYVLGQVSKFKAHLRREREFLQTLPRVYSKDIQYFKFAPNIEEMRSRSGEILNVPNVVEIDLSAAYLFAALNCGIITKEIFESIYYTVTKDNGERMQRGKGDRLKILGSMASMTEINEYTNGKPSKETEIVTDHEFRNAWFYICLQVDKIFQRLIAKIPKQYFLFYFVDGIYFIDNTETENVISHTFEAAKMPYKKVRIKTFKVYNRGKSLRVFIKKANNREKTFTVPERHIKKYYIE